MDPVKTKTDDDTAETGGLPAVVEAGMITSIRAELDTQIATAKQYPRSLKTASANIMGLATLDEETAAECMFALPRAGKPIRGASVRFAEIVHQQWGNCRVDARVIAIDRANKLIVAEGTFHDLETNSAIRTVVQRRISDKRGRIYSDDMINVTGNAACSIARRNAILAGVPKAIWRKAYEASEQVVAGDIKTLATRREAAIKAFANYGVKPEQVFAALDIRGLEDLTLEHIPTLQGMFSALKNGETTVEEMFRGTGDLAPGPAAATSPPDNWTPPPEAQPPEAHDPETGEVGPRELPRSEGEELREWAQRLLAQVRAATDLESVQAWLTRNETTMTTLLQEAPKLHTQLMAQIGRHRVSLTPQNGPSDDKPG